MSSDYPRIRGAMAGSDALYSPDGRARRARLAELVASPRPMSVEIGFGHGHFLAALAAAEPDLTVVGMEIQQGWVRMAERRAAKLGVTNLFALKADARVLLTLDIPPGRLSHVHILFPDPWWKPKHHKKRRLFTPELLDVLARAIHPGGTLTLRTDVEAYARSSAAMAEAHPAFTPAPPTAAPGHDIPTRRE